MMFQGAGLLGVAASRARRAAADKRIEGDARRQVEAQIQQQSEAAAIS